ncbi:MAG: hypothetical protein MUP64_09015 [Anaerolineae bacterium]|nr:hypothetical protein [Anaerolineae bacterium]
MVRVKAPLFSLAASGTLGKSIVFSNWKGVDYVRRHAIPSNPKDPLQIAIRSMFKFLSQEWTSFQATPKASWDEKAAAANVSPFNSYVGFNMFRHRNNLPPTKDSNLEMIGVAGDVPTTTATGGVRQVTLSIAKGAAAPSWGWMIHRAATGFTPSWANAIALIPYSATPSVYVDTPLAPGPYYYRIKGFADDGLFGSLEAERTATAT